MNDPSESASRVQLSEGVFGLLARVVHRTAQDAAAGCSPGGEPQRRGSTWRRCSSARAR